MTYERIIDFMNKYYTNQCGKYYSSDSLGIINVVVITDHKTYKGLLLRLSNDNCSSPMEKDYIKLGFKVVASTDYDHLIYETIQFMSGVVKCKTCGSVNNGELEPCGHRRRFFR